MAQSDDDRRDLVRAKRASQQAKAKARARRQLEEAKRKGVKGGPAYGSYKIDDMPVSREQYLAYQELKKTDPGMADSYAALIDTRGPNAERKEGQYLNLEDMKTYKRLVARGDKSAAEMVWGKNPRVSAADEKQLRGFDPKKPEEPMELSWREGYGPSARGPSGKGTLGTPPPASGIRDLPPGLAPSQRGGRTTVEEWVGHATPAAAATTQAPASGSAVAELMKSQGTQLGPGTGVKKLINASGIEFDPNWKVMLDRVEGTPGTPSRGHMNDPEAVKSTPSKYRVATVDETYNQLWDWTPQKVMAFQKAQGLTPTGEAGDATQAAWAKVLVHAARLYAAGQRVSLESLYGYRSDADKPGTGGRGGPGEAGGGPYTTTDVALTNRGEAKRLLNALFRQSLGRGVTEDEVSRFQTQLNAAQQKNPKVTTGQKNEAGSLDTGTASGGLDVEQFGEDYMRSTMGGEVNARMVGVDYLDAALGAIGAGVK